MSEQFINDFESTPATPDELGEVLETAAEVFGDSFRALSHDDQIPVGYSLDGRHLADSALGARYAAVSLDYAENEGAPSLSAVLTRHEDNGRHGASRMVSIEFGSNDEELFVSSVDEGFSAASYRSLDRHLPPDSAFDYYSDDLMHMPELPDVSTVPHSELTSATTQDVRDILTAIELAHAQRIQPDTSSQQIA